MKTKNAKTNKTEKTQVTIKTEKIAPIKEGKQSKRINAYTCDRLHDEKGIDSYLVFSGTKNKLSIIAELNKLDEEVKEKVALPAMPSLAQSRLVKIGNWYRQLFDVKNVTYSVHTRKGIPHVALTPKSAIAQIEKTIQFKATHKNTKLACEAMEVETGFVNRINSKQPYYLFSVTSQLDKNHLRARQSHSAFLVNKTNSDYVKLEANK